MGGAGYRWIRAQRSRESSNAAALALTGELIAERTDTVAKGDTAMGEVDPESDLLLHSPAN